MPMPKLVHRLKYVVHSRRGPIVALVSRVGIAWAPDGRVSVAEMAIDDQRMAVGPDGGSGGPPAGDGVVRPSAPGDKSDDEAVREYRFGDDHDDIDGLLVVGDGWIRIVDTERAGDAGPDFEGASSPVVEADSYDVRCAVDKGAGAIASAVDPDVRDFGDPPIHRPEELTPVEDLPGTPDPPVNNPAYRFFSDLAGGDDDGDGEPEVTW